MRSDPQSDDLPYFKLRLLTSGNQPFPQETLGGSKVGFGGLQPPQEKDKGAASQPLYHTVALNKTCKISHIAINHDLLLKLGFSRSGDMVQSELFTIQI